MLPFLFGWYLVRCFEFLPILVQKEFWTCGMWWTSALLKKITLPRFPPTSMPRLSLDSLFLGWSHLGSNLRKTNCACLSQRTGRSAHWSLPLGLLFVLSLELLARRIPARKHLLSKKTHCTLISYELLVASNCQHLINRFKHDVSRIHNFCANIWQPQKRGSLLTVGSMFLYARFAQIHRRSKLHVVLLVM